MVLTDADFSVEIDFNAATNFKISSVNNLGITGWSETYDYRRQESIPSQAQGSQAFQSFQAPRIINLQIDIETFDPDEMTTAKDELEAALVGSPTDGGGFRQNHFTLYRYLGGGGSRFLSDCFCKSYNEQSFEAYKIRGNNLFTPISIVIFATNPDWQTSGAAAGGTTVNGSILINVTTGQTALSIFNTDTGKFVTKLDSAGNELIAGGLETRIGNISVP